MSLGKIFEPATIEQNVLTRWEEIGNAKLDTLNRERNVPFSMVLPPPNITGKLHIGHAVNITIQDILARWKSMQGFDVFWQAGIDHAGISTQLVVERELLNAGKPSRRELGREGFLREVWDWKEKLGADIFSQIKRLGASCDWHHTRFTMDDAFSRVVVRVFVDFYKRGLIYKGDRLVNWDPSLQTAISDLEVITREVIGSLWHFSYPIHGETDRFIIVSTTRPETLLGDSAIAVHPQDKRYHSLIGRHAVLPLVGRKIPIIADEYVDVSKGYGAIKITPAHDFNDFHLGMKHNLQIISVFDTEARIDIRNNDGFLLNLKESCSSTSTTDKAYSMYVMSLEDLIREVDGFDRFNVRAKIVDKMEQFGLLVGSDSIVHRVPHGDRSDVVLEPMLKKQWYINVDKLAPQAVDAVVTGKTKFIPSNWEKTYFQWMSNIQDWCISRQLWWGHQIPAWYSQEVGDDGVVFVEETEEQAQLSAKAYYGRSVDLKRDEDVLDTWFSSALWPLVTLGWPDDIPKLQRYYPVSVLVTGFDIVFFWVARMMMMCMEHGMEVPFKDVYVHPLIRDSKGAKMSKSKGNVVDPVEIIGEYGADALRLSITTMLSPGMEIKLSLEHVAKCKAFATKIWNTARFIEMNECAVVAGFDVEAVVEPVNRWILSMLSKTVGDVNSSLSNYMFSEASSYIWRFVWNKFCDWYLELAKVVFRDGSKVQINETKAVCAYSYGEILKMAHPFIPFVTEDLFNNMGTTIGANHSITLSMTKWVELDYNCSTSCADIDSLIDLISEIRSVRTYLKIPPSHLMSLIVVGVDGNINDGLILHLKLLKCLARIADISFAELPPDVSSVQIIWGNRVVYLLLDGVIDIAKEGLRLEKEKQKLEKEISDIDAKLRNALFLERAKQSVIDEITGKKDICTKRLGRINDTITRINRTGV